MKPAKPTNSNVVSEPTQFQGIDGTVYSQTSGPDSTQPMVFSALQTEITSGPLPHPELLKRYDEIIPNGAERIMAMTEKEQDRRLSRQEMSLKSSIRSRDRGQFMAFILALIILGIFVLMVFTGNSTSAYVIIGTGCLSVIGLFLDVLKKRK